MNETDGVMNKLIKYFMVSYDIIANGVIYGRGMLRTKNLYPQNGFINKVKTRIINELNKKDNSLNYTIVALSKQITKDMYEKQDDLMILF